MSGRWSAWTARRRWWLLAACWAVLLVFGITGFIQQSNDLDADHSFLDHLYFTLQLAALDYQGASEAINWRLQVVRFVAPLMTAGTLLQSASVVFRDQFTRWRATKASGHTLVCGLDPVGTRLAEALVADGRQVVAIASESNTAGEATLRRLDVPVVVGDPTDPTVLRAVRADRAARVVAVTPSDATNVAIAASLRDITRPSGQRALRCAVRMTDGELAHLLRSTELGGAGDVRLEFFNVQERAAKALLASHPLDPMPSRDAPADATPPRLLVMGLGQFGGNVVVTAAQRWAERGDGPLRMTLIDRQVDGRLQALVMQHPALATALDATCIGLDIGSPTQASVAQFDRAMSEEPPTLAVIAFEDETLAWTSGLFVRRHVRRPMDIVVRTDSDGGFGRHLQTTVDSIRTPGTIVSFPFLDRACTVDLIEGGVREQLARSLHVDYVARAETGSSLAVDWSELTEAQRESSRSAADAMVARVADLGGRLAPLARWDVEATMFTDAEVESLAAAEHQRWKSEREASGWRWGATRDDASHTNPLLVDWAELPDAARRYNLETAAAVPAQLARAGFQIERS